MKRPLFGQSAVSIARELDRKAPCDWCTRPARKRPRHGRRTYPHKCPHGIPCPRADALRQHDNHYPLGGRSCCDTCRAEYYARMRRLRDGLLNAFGKVGE